MEECIKSLKNQSIESEIIYYNIQLLTVILTRTAEKYGIPVYVNTGEAGIVQDWNFAYKKAQTEFVTITHQDDVYFEKYAEHVVREFEKSSKPLIFLQTMQKCVMEKK